MPGTNPDSTFDAYSATEVAKHKSVLWPILMDRQPFSWVDCPGTNMCFRILDPKYVLRSSQLLPRADRQGQCSAVQCISACCVYSVCTVQCTLLCPQLYVESIARLKAQVQAHSPASINVMLDGWSAFHHGYIGAIMSMFVSVMEDLN